MFTSSSKTICPRRFVGMLSSWTNLRLASSSSAATTAAKAAEKSGILSSSHVLRRCTHHPVHGFASPYYFSSGPAYSLFSQTIRWKHSSTQLKRMQNHPARIRQEKRMGIDRNAYEPLPPPTLTPILEPVILRNGWSKPPSKRPDYPFQIARTSNKPNDAIGFLPVYAKFRNDGTKAVTRIKKVTGDRDFFLQELRSVLQLPPKKNGILKDRIRIRAGGTIEVDGHVVSEVRKWLASLGF